MSIFKHNRLLFRSFNQVHDFLQLNHVDLVDHLIFQGNRFLHRHPLDIEFLHPSADFQFDAIHLHFGLVSDVGNQKQVVPQVMFLLDMV